MDSLGVYSPRWNEAGDALYYFHDNGQALDLMKIAVCPKTGVPKEKARLLQTVLEAGFPFSISRYNTVLLYARVHNYSNLWSMDLVQKTRTGGGRPRQITSGTANVTFHCISPDGKSIVFSKKGGTASNIYVMPVGGGEATQLTFSNSQGFINPVWSPDGKEIACISIEKGSYRIVIISASGGIPRILKHSPCSGYWLEWSPGKYILYQQPGDKNYVLLDPETGSEKLLVKTEGRSTMYSPLYSPDGQSVAVWWRRDDIRFGLWTISLKDTVQNFIRSGYWFPIGWSGDGKGIYHYDVTQVYPIICVIPAEGGNAKQIATLPFKKNANVIMVIRMSPDIRTALCSVSETRSDIWSMTRFDPDLK